MYSEEDAFRIEAGRMIANAKTGANIIVIVDDGAGFEKISFTDSLEFERRLLDEAWYVVRQDQEKELG